MCGPRSSHESPSNSYLLADQPPRLRHRADQATAKFLPELLNSREFRERYEIRRRPLG